MGYRVKELHTKFRAWKIQYEKTESGKRRAKDLKESDYLRLGITENMTALEVRARCKQLNQQIEVKRLEERRIKIADRVQLEETKNNAYFPAERLTQFEALYISGKVKSHWRVVKKLLTQLQLDFTQYCSCKDQIYRKLREYTYSFSYVEKIIHLINRWGSFQAAYSRIYYEIVPYPRYIEKERIIEQHERSKGTFESLPLTPELLENKKEHFKSHQYHWLYISVWFGLRPSEIDRLLKPCGTTTWYVDNGTLWIYQTKLIGLAKKDRLKPIPLKYPEQGIGYNWIQSGELERPLAKVMQKYFGERITLYAGRKGFTDLMLSKGNSLESISQWMGHQSLDRTWKVYKNKKKVLL